VKARGNKPRFGQHFLVDNYVIDKIIATIAPRAQDRVIEIGPGAGALTFQLAERVAELTAIEIDSHLANRLSAQAIRYPNLRIINADALTVDYSKLTAGSRQRLVGNLPYQISTPLLERFVSHWSAFSDFTIMVQKEVAERLAAEPGTKAFGRLTILLQARAAVDLLFDIPPEAFAPPPRVWSSLVWIKPQAPTVEIRDRALLQQVVVMAFGQRRKQLHKCLSGLFDAETLQSLSIDPKSRAEQLTVTDFIRLANFLATTRTHET
jgi:16S rRNA (adenine1518-N6/adenine1519-N6)-dimethyltransferase